MKKLKIFQTSDIHGNIYPTNYVDHRDQGLAKISSIIKHRSQDGDYHLCFDSGDILQGSSLAFYTERHQITEPSIIDAFNLIGYDGVSLGNHEFNYGLDYLTKHYSRYQGPILCANIENLPFATKPYEIYEVEDVKIAVIGLTTHYVPNWENPENIKNLKFLSPVETYAKYESELQANADMIIVNYHGGFELDTQNCSEQTERPTGENLASKMLLDFPSIDILLTGHQHRLIACETKGTTCVQPGPYGQNVSEITIDLETKKVINQELISCKDYDADPEILSYFKELHDNCNDYLDTTVAKLDRDVLIEDVHAARLNSHPLLSFIGQAFNDYENVDVIALSLFDTAIGFSQDVSIRQVNQNYPFPNTIMKIELTGAQIIAAIKQSNEYYTLDANDEITVSQRFIEPKLKHYNYDMYWGVNYDVYVTHTTNEIKNVTINNQAIDLTKTYSMLVSNYRYNDRADYPVYADVTLINESQDDAVEILLTYLSKYEKITVEDTVNYKIINSTKA